MKRITLLLFLGAACLNAAAQITYARQGILDLRAWDFEKDGYVSLDGEWGFYMSELITPAAVQKASARDFVSLPSTWNETSSSLEPGKGFATYNLRIVLAASQTLALEIPQLYSSYKLWVNDREVASNGVVGTSQETSKPQWRPQTVTFDPGNDTLDVVLQVANFDHAIGGIREKILIGLPEDLAFKREISVTSIVTLAGVLFVLAAAFVLIFVFVKKDRAAVYFSLLCLSWAIRACFSNLYVFTSVFPDFPWEIAVKIEYITLYLTMIWTVFFVGSIFPQESSPLFKYSFSAFNLIFTGFTVIAGASLYTQFLPIYLSFAAFLLLYTIYVLIRAVVQERQGVWLMVSCIMLGVVIFAYDLIAYEGFMSYNSVITHFGYIGMFLLMGFCLAYQTGMLRRSSSGSNVLTYEDLYGRK